MIGGGPFNLEPGQWTDDTWMALCLAESLLEMNGFDAIDQLARYVRWKRTGQLTRCDLRERTGAGVVLGFFVPLQTSQPELMIVEPGREAHVVGGIGGGQTSRARPPRWPCRAPGFSRT